MTKFRLALMPCFTVLIFLTTFALAEEKKYEDLSIEELMEVKVSVVTKKEQSTREAPGIATVITENDIRNMGARDLIDILRTVPGFSFAFDTWGVVSLGIRGLWAQDGKHLLIIDGVEMTELQYSSNNYGNDLPVDQIKRIEIIRGPGSAIYGGFAELGVINITTKSGADLKGGTSQLTAGQWKSTTARTNISVAGGNELAGGDYSASFYTGKSRRGDGDYSGQGTAASNSTTYTGAIDFEKADELKPLYFNFGYNKKRFKFRFLMNRNQVDSYTLYGMTSSQGKTGVPVLFESYNLLTSYEGRLAESTTLTPQLQVFRQRPWVIKSDEAVNNYARIDVSSLRIRPSLTLKSDITNKLNFLAGVEHTADQHRINDYDFWDTGVLYPTTFANGTRKKDMTSTAAYVQSLYSMDDIELTAGARFEKPNKTRGSLVPRLGLTRAEKTWHAKVLYSHAYRSPGLFNYEYKTGSDIVPERLETSEFEWGHVVGSKSYFTANVFHTVIRDPIVFAFGGSETYDNHHSIGSDGVELQYVYKPSWGQMQVRYSFYKRNQSDVPNQEVPDKDDQFLAFPQHTATLNTTYYLTSHLWRLNSQLQYLGEKSGYDFDGTAMVLRKIDPTVLFNFYLSKDDFFTRGLGFGVGVFNILDQKDYFVQAYNGGHSPVPAPSRELMVRLDYSYQ